MKLSMGLKVSASLSLTPQLQQAIKLLQLSSLELEQEIQNQLDNNPLLELIEPGEQEGMTSSGQAIQALDTHQLTRSELAASDWPASATSSNQSGSTGPAEQAQAAHAPVGTDELQPLSLSEQMQATRLGDDLSIDTQWDDIFIHHSTAMATPDHEPREDNYSKQQSMAEQLRWQMNLAHFNPVDQLIAECIIDGIDERGYLHIGLDEVQEAATRQLAAMAAHKGRHLPDEPIAQAEVEMVLKRIQHFEPAGVAARNLQECLTLQLQSLPEQTPCRNNALTLLKHHELLLANDLNRLMRQTRLDQPALTAALQLIKTLDPYPGQQFADDTRDYQVPDVIVRKKNHQWEVQLNTDMLPRLRVNGYYAGLIRRADNSSDNQYLRQHLYEARNFIKSVEERHKTLLKVASCIVRHQRNFLEQGPQGMKPLVLREVAEEVELHESTVSRVTTQKFMLTPRGLFELKYFFSSHVGTSSGETCSSTAIRAMIKHMIQQENARKPLSDNAIALQLQREGIDVARRTVAKYRELLNIAPSSDRKRLL